MTDKFKQTVKIIRRPKVTTDDRGRTVWTDTVQTASLELVSTQMLEQLIESDVDGAKDRILEAAAGKDGVLAQDSDNGKFEIISDEELQQILNGGTEQPETKRVADVIYEPLSDIVDENEELELVSTQMLRQILGPEDAEQAADDEPAESGFDPYNNA